MKPAPRRALNRERLAQAADALATRDEHLASIVERLGHPPLWGRRPGFVTLIRIILEQQVSLASARAVYRRLAAEIHPLTAEHLIETGERRLRELGLTRQKARYCLNVAEVLASNELDLRNVSRADDEAAVTMLTAIKGIGPWTAECYLLMALRRPDVWPAGDIALATAVREVKQLRERPSPERLTALAEPWRPYRATAARLLWHYYLNR